MLITLISVIHEPLEAHFEEETVEEIIYFHLRLTSPVPTLPPRLILEWFYPAHDIHAHWNPVTGLERSNDVNWGELGGDHYHAKATYGAPVHCLHSFSGENRLTFAFSDALNSVVLRGGVEEETARFRCSLELALVTPLTEYQATLRLDTRAVPYYQSLREVGDWWARQPGYAPAPVPHTAYRPMYSTWYSFHLKLSAEKIEHQALLAQQLGCEAIIVDDGWQTSDQQRGYAYCGDWKPTPDKIDDMRAHVNRVHQMGLKYLLWYSVPFVGRYSQAWSRFQGKFLDEHPDWRVLDPRFPQVREYLIQIYEQAALEWNLDGFKLDFVDSFFEVATTLESHDHRSVMQAVDQLLTEVITRLRQLNPDIMIEFRQNYVGPLMRKYGNLFRAGDCPNDPLHNRVKTLDLRLLAGNTAVHSDMLMWNPTEPVESAAMQFTNILFAVPQVSMRLDELSESHSDMVRFWLGFFNDHHEVLLHGELMPLHPEGLYPIVMSKTAACSIAAVYMNTVIRPLPAETIILVNSTFESRLILECETDLGERKVETLDCCGNRIALNTMTFTSGLYSLPVPACGMVYLRQV